MKWFVLSFTLLIQHWAYSQVPVLQVQLGKPATFLCALPKFRFTQREIYWYKQSPGDNLRLIVKLIIKHQKSTISKVGTQLSELRWKTNNNKEMSILTIVTIKQEDFGMYHCAIKASNGNPEWSATILIIKGHNAGTLNHNVVQWPTAPDPVNAQDSMIMQCSALSDVENKMCPEDISMLWFTTKSENCHPEINHTDGNRCNQFMRSDSPLNCFHHFFNNVISSDGANVYCTVPLCGAILFGNATKLEAEKAFTIEIPVLFIGVTSLIISVIEALLKQEIIPSSKLQKDRSKKMMPTMQHYISLKEKKEREERKLWK